MQILIDKKDLKKVRELGLKPKLTSDLDDTYYVEATPDNPLDYLSHIHNEAENKKLREARELVADSAFEEYDFEKEGVFILGCDNWYFDGEDKFVRRIYLEPIVEKVDQSGKGSFSVEFKPNTIKVIDIHAWL